MLSQSIGRVVALGVGLLGLTPAGAGAGPARIVVGPNILVSRDGDVAHCETMIAANSKDPKNLLGGSIVMARPDGGAANKAYVSFDGGASWNDVVFPEEMEHGGGDPQVGFGASGTAYFVGLSKGMNFYRSEDGGRTWGKAISLGDGHDHEMLVTDMTTGPYAGRVYITDETDQKGSNELEDMQMKRRVVLFRSSDDGRSWTGPVEVAAGEGKGLAAYNLLVLSDGTLFIPMMEYPNYAIDKEASSWRLIYSLSRDGGVTFSPKKPIVEVSFGGLKAMRDQQKSGRVDGISGPVFGVDPGGKFPDRLYAAWTERDGARFRLKFRYSKDRGATWSKPKPVDQGAPATASEYLPVIAVNPDGALGVFFYSTEGYPKHDASHAWFTASVDGGETFLPKARVSSAASRPFGAGNVRPGPHVRIDRGLLAISTLSGLSRWPDGGDYIGMTADANGVFHPFFPDGRSGTYQLFTAGIRVATDAPGKAPAVEKANLNSRVTLAFDPIQYDAGTREVRMPVRLKNVSKETLYPPFLVEIKEVAHPYTIKSGEEVNAPVFLNSSNGERGVGATFDYTKVLGGLTALEPDAVSDAVEWRLQAESPVKTDFFMGADVSGFVAKKEEKK